MSVSILAQAARKKIGDGPPFREDQSNTGKGHGHGGMDEAKSTCPTPGVACASSELKACLASAGITKSGAAFSPCTCCYSLGHFGITLPLVYLTRAPGVPHQGNGSHGRRATVLNAVGVRGQGGNREVGGGLRCWWADRLEWKHLCQPRYRHTQFYRACVKVPLQSFIIYYTLLYSILFYSILFYSILLYYTISCYIPLQCILLYDIMLQSYYIILYYTTHIYI